MIQSHCLSFSYPPHWPLNATNASTLFLRHVEFSLALQCLPLLLLWPKVFCVQSSLGSQGDFICYFVVRSFLSFYTEENWAVSVHLLHSTGLQSYLPVQYLAVSCLFLRLHKTYIEASLIPAIARSLSFKEYPIHGRIQSKYVMLAEMLCLLFELMHQTASFALSLHTCSSPSSHHEGLSW